ncbi:MAG: TonB-dependent receptor [Chitinophagaceae bacterium]|nr:TonB-dependent receptor [Chitinophagaceae bacterium]
MLVLFSIPLKAQQKVTLSGYVKEAATGETLIGATIGVKGTSNGTSSNDYGFYSFSIAPGIYTFVFSYLGFEEIDTTVTLSQDLRININMKTAVNQLQEITVEASDTKDENIRSSQMGKFDLSMDKIKTLPVIFGEQDILKTIQLLPGIQGGGEGSSGFYVRGGGPDQNLILLDEATVYNASHLFGFFSVFNSDAIQNTTLYKEGMPAEYGGRISSVLDISMKDGNNQAFSGSGGIGAIASRLTLEGPIVKGKSSFIVSGRRTYIDVITKPFITNSEFAGSTYYFYDLNAKANYNFSDKDRLYLSGYFGRDVFAYKSDDINLSIPWGNATATLRWNHLFNNKLFMNASVIYQDYHFELLANQNLFEFSLFSGIRDFNTKVDFDFFPNVRHQVKFGVNYIYHNFQPSSVSGKSGDVEFNPEGIQHLFAHEAATYVQDQFDISENFQLTGGIRFSYFEQIGPYKQLIYNDFTGALEDSIVYKSGEHIKTYGGIEPRLMGRFALNRSSSLKAAFTINNQYVHLVTNNGTTLPTDVWVPSSTLVKPQIGYQYSLGYFKNFKDNAFETSVEVYYKQLKNQIEYREGYTPSPNEVLEESFVFGEGSSYGIELFINKKYGDFTGWVGYTLAFTDRTFADLNNGETFPYKYDRRNNVSVVGSYRINEHWTLGATFVFQTGIAFTLPDSKYFIEGNILTHYSGINDIRLPSYHRMDIAATYEGRKDRKFQSGWSFSIYNVYNRANPYFVYTTYDGTFLQDEQITIQAKQVSLFPIIPSITWNFKF